MIQIQLEHVSKVFQQGGSQIVALDDISLRIREGEFVTVMGKSGSGKTTLLNIISGQEQADRGIVSVLGRDLQELNEEARATFRRSFLGVVFQTFNLMSELSALENVALPLLLNNSSRKLALAKAKNLLEQVSLSHRQNHLPQDLSGGEKQRVAIARALITEPSLLLADEPTGNLDSNTAEQILSLLKTIQKDSGQSLIMVTHDARAAAYGDRLIRLKQGKLVRQEDSDVATRFY